MSMKSSDFSERVYSDGRTKQAFKDSTDVNRLLHRHAKAGTLSVLAKQENMYGDFANYDFHEHQNRIAAGNTLFEELPSEIRREFKNDPQEFFEFVNQPEHVGRLAELLPGLAEPGTQLPKLNPRVPPEDAPARVASEQPPTEAPLPPPVENAPAGDTEA